MKPTPIKNTCVDQVMEEQCISDFNHATIRQVVAVVSKIEALSGEKFVRMEMGVPGLPPAAVGTAAEIEALQKGVAAVYPIIDGIPSLKHETSRFIKAFTNLNIPEEGCVPVVGSMQGSFSSFMLCGQIDPKKDTILFIDPGFPVQKQQLKVLGYKCESFDVYDFRNEKLHDKLESYLKKGTISALIYSNPNNPAWICMTEQELKTIGELATQYDTIVLEDLAYFGMDFRQNLGTPFEAPYQVSIANYTDNYVLMISGSKIFSYAGQRIAVVAISPKLYHRVYPALVERYGKDMGSFGRAFVMSIIYTISSGVSHSSQYALAAMFKASSDGEFKFIDEIKEYGRRAEKLKRIFCQNGFKIVYDKDNDREVSDGFYFTITYPRMTSAELMRELLYYGVSAISLATCGSKQEGLRACTSNIHPEQYDVLEKRLKIFQENHPR